MVTLDDDNKHTNIHMMTLFVISCFAILDKTSCHLKVFLLSEAFTNALPKLKMIELGFDIATD